MAPTKPSARLTVAKQPPPAKTARKQPPPAKTARKLPTKAATAPKPAGVAKLPTKPERAKAKVKDKPKAPRKTCVVCAYDLLLARFPKEPTTATCDHDNDTCRGCIRTNIATALEDRGHALIRCAQCNEHMELSDLKTHAEKKTYQRIEAYHRRAKQAAIPDFQFCQTPGCEGGAVHPDINTPLFCTDCNSVSCVSCGGQWHNGQSCTQRITEQRAHDEALSEKEVAETAKVCPGKGCGARIQKNGGCLHMTCTVCHVVFQWPCLCVYPAVHGVPFAHRVGCHSTAGIARDPDNPG